MEASAAEELSENFNDYKKFYVPEIFWKYTRKRILVLEYIEGVRMDNKKSLEQQKRNINEITKTSAEVFFLQVFRDGFFHGDMHPGNIFIDKYGRIVPIDFGIMGRLSNKDRYFLAQLLTNLLNKNYKKVVQIHAEANMLGKNLSHEELAQAIRAIATPILNKPLAEVSLAKLLGEILGLSKNYDIFVQSQFTLLQKTMVMAEGVARQISPKTNIWELSKPLIQKWIEESNDPFNIIDDWIHQNKILLLKLPELINIITELIEKKIDLTEIN